MYTDGDLQINTVGAAYMQYQSGHATVVTAGDSSYDVVAGQYTVKALNGISLTAGQLPSAPETVVSDGQGGTTTAAGLDTGSASGANNWAGDAATPDVQHPADLYLWASNNINLKAFGPQAQITYGDAYENVQGNKTDIWNGTEYKETHGEQTEHLYADSHTTHHANKDSVTLGGTSSVFLGGHFSFKLDVQMSIVMGIDVDINISLYLKMSATYVTVLGLSVKAAYSDSTYCLTMTYKSVPIDNKTVTFDAKTLVFAVENGVISMKNTNAITADEKALYASQAKLIAKQAEIDTKITALKTVF